MNTSADVGHTSLADVDSIDTPPRVTPASSPLPRATTVTSRKESSKKPHRAGDDMEDIFDSQASSTAASTGRQAPAKEVSRGGHAAPHGTTAREGSGDSATTVTASATGSTVARTRVPSKENLYGHRSHSKKSPTQRTRSPNVQRGAPQWGKVSSPATLPYSTHPSTPALAQQYGAHMTADQPPNEINTPTPHVKGRTAEHILKTERDPAVSTDALLRRMKDKEKEFDEKIHTIHNTFQNAGEQLVVRDGIIAQLQDDLAQLRSEASHVRKDYQTREETLLLRVEDMMRELQEEQTRTKQHRRAADEEARQLRAALNTADKQLAQQQRVSDDLLRQLRTSDKALQEEKAKHAAALQDSRQIYEDKLTELQRVHSAVGKELVKAQTRSEEAEKDRAECQAKLLEHELDSRRQRSGDSRKTKTLVTENDALREEVEAVQLSMARLLLLMSEVPALADYLQWNELSSKFVFLGYPTQYFADGNAGNGFRTMSTSGRGKSTRSQRNDSRQTSPARRRAGGISSRSAEYRSGLDYSGVHLSPSSSSAAASPYYQDVNFSGSSFIGTGVEDGVYAGVASSLSKNVWLSGRWAQQMMDIIAAENIFTRLKRIKLLELEEAAQLSVQLPSARDVLEGRRPEKDYWIPYDVFIEAQKFKNKYYPKLPAMSHFYPFLIQLNRIWRAKLQDRLRVRQDDRRRPVSRQRSAVADSRSPHRRRAGDTTNEGEVSIRTTSRSVTASHLDAHRPEELLSELVHCEACLNEIQEEHHRLRRDVRLHVSSQKTRQLFHQYDELICRAHRSFGHMLRLADELYSDSSSAANRQAVTGEGDRAQARAAESLRDAQRQAQMAADIADAEDARDHLLCVVERTCERVCDVGDSLSTRMVSYYSDLHQLIHILHDHLRQLRARGDTNGEDNSSSTSTVSSNNNGDTQGAGGGATKQARRRKERNVELSHELRRALLEQYGTTEALRNDGASATLSPASGAIGVDSLLKLAASVLDFGNEVRKEVADASAALRNIAEQAMHEADPLQEDA
ncbi:hypothetical protein ABB37_03231 [Leptomonas pyrrhocoris]|uniref:Uncharacterized protein n=1 Tax=Leptomonas pyrrhocoris TaxID=157538 RepID=A0A0M9G4G5_LEPPY|nr:hypothetical protein ABB37_03231 [Leptomonas pyrrhocoris]KPA82073.1 hypothetical protein ABB37_03231 [Leptomonas pyrrhocoris]|eukprot:XP_015660512.1 hypothetical protein ABB37_03231 [Leptomonas pyrrhocoris]